MNLVRTGRDKDVTDIELMEVLELQNCEALLQQTLKRLDQLGAGIAAIHVNAAIEQIKVNQISIKAGVSNGLDLENAVCQNSPVVMH